MGFGIQLDASGARQISQDAEMVLADEPKPCGCTSACTCPLSDLLSYALTTSDLSACITSDTDCDWVGFPTDENSYQDSSDVVSNSEGDYCLFSGVTGCHDTNDTNSEVRLVDDPVLGCIWRSYVRQRNQFNIDEYEDVWIGYRLLADGIVGAHTKTGGCAASATVT